MGHCPKKENECNNKFSIVELQRWPGLNKLGIRHNKTLLFRPVC